MMRSQRGWVKLLATEFAQGSDLPNKNLMSLPIVAPACLSLTGDEGDILESNIFVFEIQECDGKLAPHQTLTDIETNFVHYTWGPNGEWLIAPVQTNQQAKQVKTLMEAYELLRVRVSLTVPSIAFWESVGLVDQQFLTDNIFYENLPDWAP